MGPLTRTLLEQQEPIPAIVGKGINEKRAHWRCSPGLGPIDDSRHAWGSVGHPRSRPVGDASLGGGHLSCVAIQGMCRSVHYTGQACSASFLEGFFSETGLPALKRFRSCVVPQGRVSMLFPLGAWCPSLGKGKGKGGRAPR